MVMVLYPFIGWADGGACRSEESPAREREEKMMHQLLMEMDPGPRIAINRNKLARPNLQGIAVNEHLTAQLPFGDVWVAHCTLTPHFIFPIHRCLFEILCRNRSEMSKNSLKKFPVNLPLRVGLHPRK